MTEQEYDLQMNTITANLGIDQYSWLSFDNKERLMSSLSVELLMWPLLNTPSHAIWDTSFLAALREELERREIEKILLG